jgi:sulfane dehydrogenase subunit SoxC
MRAPELISFEELALATRNHGMPLEALRYDLTPPGLHYLLVHFDIPAVEPRPWRLRVDGRVHRPLSLSLSELMDRPAVTVAVTMECAGNGRALLAPRTLSQPWLYEAVGTGSWTGTPLAPLLDEAGLAEQAVEVLFTGLDRGVEGGVEQDYARALPLAEAKARGVLLAWAMDGRPLPPQHGYPLRLIVPDWYGMTQVKWLCRITALDARYVGYQNAHAYRYRYTEQEQGQPLARMLPRSLMVPPGIPEFLSRRRLLPVGNHVLTGRAWSGMGSVHSVEVSVDGARSWAMAELGEPVGPHAWSPWRAGWKASVPGEYVLCCRATDTTGRRQPVEPDWNVGGYAVNAVQRVHVTVRPTAGE